MRKVILKPEVLVLVIISLICLSFAIYTQHAWEDYWITFRASRNLATGHGLVYTLGERLHTFTSPLGVLLPAGLSWITGNQSDVLVLWLFRLVSIAALAMGMVLLFHVLQPLQQNRMTIFFSLALFGLDSKTVDFSINGMETGLLIFFLALTIHGLLVVGQRQMWRIGIGWAGLMWTRPDSCVYIAALVLGIIVFSPNQSSGQLLNDLFKKLLLAGFVCTIIYLPWFLWAWNYYGSPVPFTIVAKSVNAAPLSLSGLSMDLVAFPVHILLNRTSVPWAFLPAYSYGWFSGSHECVVLTSLIFGSLAAFIWMFPFFRPQARLFSLTFFLGNYYLTAVVKNFYPWYLPTVALFGCLTLGMVLDQAFELVRKMPPSGYLRGLFPSLPNLLIAGVVFLIAGQMVITVCDAQLTRVEQELIENNMRRQIGIWLHDHAKTPHDTVMLEPLGYIGYFSGLKMLDYPGLSSKEMVSIRRTLGKDKENQAYLQLKPDWLVVRLTELQADQPFATARLEEFYELVQVFDATDQINSVAWLPGKMTLAFDRQFLILRRKSEDSPKKTN